MNENSHTTILTYLLLVLIGLTSSVGEILLYKGVKSANSFGLLAAAALWFVSLMLLGLLFKMEHFSFGAVVVLATIIHLTVAVLWGLFFAGNRVSLLELTGLILAVVAVIFLEAGRPG
ncbi:MAG: hypothetical protein KA368_22805 [Acidobacteria bacterium]|nr:hypothetical protein [Acidobacteriota bacterium]